MFICGVYPQPFHRTIQLSPSVLGPILGPIIVEDFNSPFKYLHKINGNYLNDRSSVCNVSQPSGDCVY